MTGLLLGVVVWPIAFIGTALFFVLRKQLLAGGVVSLMISLMPIVYGRSTTPAEWHHSPLMGIYYLPTITTALISLVLVTIGLFRSVRKALTDQTGTQ